MCQAYLCRFHEIGMSSLETLGLFNKTNGNKIVIMRLE